MADDERADRLGASAAPVRRRSRAPMRREHVEQPGARRVQADAASSGAREPGTSAAATIRNAADEKSPGSADRRALQRVAAVERHAELAAARARRRSRAACARCGRASAIGSSTRRRAARPAGPRAAIADFTCALATASVCAAPWSGRPSMRSGARPSPGSLTMRAPMRRERLDHALHRPAQQRPVADESARERTARERRRCRRRIVVPEFAQSSASAAARSPAKPRRRCAARLSLARRSPTPSARHGARASRDCRAPPWKPSTRGRAVGEGAEQKRAVRDRLVARHGQSAVQTAVAGANASAHAALFVCAARSRAARRAGGARSARAGARARARRRRRPRWPRAGARSAAPNSASASSTGARFASRMSRHISAGLLAMRVMSRKPLPA